MQLPTRKCTESNEHSNRKHHHQSSNHYTTSNHSWDAQWLGYEPSSELTAKFHSYSFREFLFKCSKNTKQKANWSVILRLSLTNHPRDHCHRRHFHTSTEEPERSISLWQQGAHHALPRGVHHGPPWQVSRSHDLVDVLPEGEDSTVPEGIAAWTPVTYPAPAEKGSSWIRNDGPCQASGLVIRSHCWIMIALHVKWCNPFANANPQVQTYKVVPTAEMSRVLWQAVCAARDYLAPPKIVVTWHAILGLVGRGSDLIKELP